MPEFEVTMQALKVRVDADTREEAEALAKDFIAPSHSRVRSLLLGAAPRVDKVEVVHEPVGTGSKAE